MFHARRDFGARNRPRAVFATDLDGDGQQGLLTTNYGAESLSLLWNLTVE
jgi:hypothetical protein